MKVSELSGGLLDYWVARATGKGCWMWSDGKAVTFVDWKNRPSLHTRFTNHSMKVFRPSSDWEHGGPIIESERIELAAPCEKGTFAGIWTANYEWGPPDGFGASTPLVAAMRAYVASKFGDEVSDEGVS